MNNVSGSREIPGDLFEFDLQEVILPKDYDVADEVAEAVFTQNPKEAEEEWHHTTDPTLTDPKRIAEAADHPVSTEVATLKEELAKVKEELAGSETKRTEAEEKSREVEGKLRDQQATPGSKKTVEEGEAKRAIEVITRDISQERSKRYLKVALVALLVATVAVATILTGGFAGLGAAMTMGLVKGSGAAALGKFVGVIGTTIVGSFYGVYQHCMAEGAKGRIVDELQGERVSSILDKPAEREKFDIFIDHILEDYKPLTHEERSEQLPSTPTNIKDKLKGYVKSTMNGYRTEADFKNGTLQNLRRKEDDKSDSPIADRAIKEATRKLMFYDPAIFKLWKQVEEREVEIDKMYKNRPSRRESALKAAYEEIVRKHEESIMKEYGFKISSTKYRGDKLYEQRQTPTSSTTNRPLDDTVITPLNDSVDPDNIG